LSVSGAGGSTSPRCGRAGTLNIAVIVEMKSEEDKYVSASIVANGNIRKRPESIVASFAKAFLTAPVNSQDTALIPES